MIKKEELIKFDYEGFEKKMLTNESFDEYFDSQAKAANFNKKTEVRINTPICFESNVEVVKQRFIEHGYNVKVERKGVQTTFTVSWGESNKNENLN